MQLSKNGLKLIQSFEGCRLESYQDVAGNWTIGWGHTKGVTKGETITQTEADNLLKGDLKEFTDGVNALVKVNISQNQFDALVSFAYNLGLTNLENSDLLSYLNQGDSKRAALEFPKWDHAREGGVEVEVQGLLNRRLAEQKLFNTPVPKPPTKSYTVSKGENLTLIANRFGVSVKKILSLNPDIKDPNLIQIGQVLNVPNTSPKPKPQTVPTSLKYVVRPGENLTVIANRLGVSLSEVLRLNPQIKNPNYVLIGQVINVPNK